MNLPPAHILCIDDDHTLRLMVRHVLRRAGFSLTDVASGEEALDQLEAGLNVDLILLDALLPGLDGFEMCRRLRALPLLAECPILMITALDDESSIEQAFASGATDLIHKPINWALLRQRIHRLTRSRARIVSAEARMDGLLQRISEAVLVFDALGQVEAVNPAAELLFGQPTEQLIGQPVATLFANGWPAQPIPDALVTTTVQRAGMVVTVELTVRPLPGGAALVVARDVTARVEAELVRKQLDNHAQLNQRLDTLAAVSGGLAHEFNNLLTGIVGYADLLKVTLPASSATAPHIAGLLEATERARRLTEQFLTLAGKSQSRRRPLDLNRQLAGLESLLKAVLPRSARLQIVPPTQPLGALADPKQLDQAVVHLALNAAEAQAPTGGVVRLRIYGDTWPPQEAPPLLPIGPAPAPGAFAVIEVSDNGPGVPLADQVRIFEPYYTTKANNWGMGLAMVLGVVRSHQGTIQVLSAPGAGTTMRLWLPAVPVATPVLSAPAPLPPPPVAGKTVLVVADEIMIRRIVSETLTRSGYRVLAAADGREAVEFFQQANGAVDLLLTDLHMPNMDGETLIITLRERHPGLTVLLMSGQALMLDTERVNRLKLDGMVAKPFRVTELLAQVATVLAPRPPMS